MPGERHHVDGFGGPTACGVDWRPIPPSAILLTVFRSAVTCPACYAALSRRPRATVRVMVGGETRTRWPVEHACAEQSERCVVTSGGALHYVGNTTTIPGASQWCSAPVPR